MASWNLEFEDGYFRIFDSKKLVAGYFDPNYGDLIGAKNPEDVILSKIKNNDTILDGMIMFPLVKFKLFDTDLNTTLSEVQQNILRVSIHLQKWSDFLSKINSTSHFIGISHTDQDMLTMTFHVKFLKPTILKKSNLLEEILPILSLLEQSELL
ncbi:MAG: hypothetical protein MT332_04855 [Candidatus Nitrosopumilus limneticus]|nr:hypothetical protein [Candidatus Nitrosopumilus limneticus]MDC4212566.1 hypothetical protein [Candidatus Nitrosopumilus limneticus]MDC4215101.1 hypothetical protein [Candidatus Nitrosopumilus limneticus]MDC4215426.1 hypothetical protein [Candidatus Nitrosopumilus limneticus]MDC4217128.1 hypothetical protein [Candidatus Nitrosopumilus limneticus]